MYACRNMCMSFNFGEEIPIIKGSPKWDLYIFWWVQAFGLLQFDSMLFFGPSFSHLVFYFGYFLEIQWYLSKLKKADLACQIWVK